MLLLDEPDASLDPDVGDRMRHISKPISARVTTHDAACQRTNMGEVERMCTDVLMRARRSLVDRGSPRHCSRATGARNMEKVFLDVARRTNGRQRREKSDEGFA